MIEETVNREYALLFPLARVKKSEIRNKKDVVVMFFMYTTLSWGLHQSSEGLDGVGGGGGVWYSLFIKNLAH